MNKFPKIKIIFFSLIFLSGFLVWGNAEAATYWVSPSGSAAWSACQSESDPGSNYCLLSTANTNLVAGDKVFLKEGIYTTAIQPSNSGNCTPPTFTDACKIIYQNAPGETPIIESNATKIFIDGKDFIKITGDANNNIICRNGTGYWANIRNYADYNEIAYVTFTNTSSASVGGSVLIWGQCSGGSPYNCDSTHNWIHHNNISRYHASDPCAEAVDTMKVGGAFAENNSNNNTIENNVFSYAGHTLLDIFTEHNVVRNNVFHNEPWIEGCENWKTVTSVTENTIGTGKKTFAISAGLDWRDYVGTKYDPYILPVSVVDQDDQTNAMGGYVYSYDNDTGVIVVEVETIGGAGTKSAWYITDKWVPKYTNSEYDNKFGHRCLQLSPGSEKAVLRTLVEGNRIGYASTNPGNSGPMNFDLAAPGNIARYNDLYNGMQSGIYFKYTGATNSYAPGGTNNRVYNNTIYNEGHGYNWELYHGTRSDLQHGITLYNSGTDATENVIKNNIIYSGQNGDVCGYDSGTCSNPQTYQNSSYTIVNNFCSTVAGAWCDNKSGNPLFINPDVSDPTSTILPNLTLQSSSPAINGGTHLTESSSADTNSIILVVDDAEYFQDGTDGSDLARGSSGNFYPDWICIGTTDNCVQIISINYDTNIITLDSAKTWNDNAPIWLYKKSDGTQVLYGSAPDYGAHEYVTTGSDTISPAAPSGLAVQ